MHTKLKNSNIQEANLKEDFLSSNKVKGEQWEKKKGCKEGLSGVDSLVAKSQVQCINLSSCIITSYYSARKKKKKIPDSLRNQPTNLIIDGVRW